MKLLFQSLSFATQYIYYFDIAALCCLVVLGVAYITRKNYLNKVNTLFKIMYFCVLLATISDLSGAIIINNYQKYNAFLVYATNMLFYMSFSLMGPLFFLYVIYAVGKRKTNLYEKIMCHVCIIFEILSVLTTPLTKLVFYIDYNDVNKEIYHRGVFLSLMYGISLFFLLQAIIIFFRNKKGVTKSQYASIVFFSLSMCGTIIFQLYYQYILLECFALSLFLFITYFNIQTPDYYINKLSGCLNSVAFIDNVTKKMKENEKFSIIAFSFEDYRSYVQAIGKDNETILSKKIGGYLTHVFGDNKVFGLRNGRYIVIINNDEILKNDTIRKIEIYFEKPIMVDKCNVKLKPYFLIFNYPEFSINVDNLLDLIDYSLDVNYIGKNKIVNVMTNEVIIKKNRENQIIQIMKNALKNDQGFTIYFQPIFDTINKNFYSMEALLRLKDDTLGHIGPDEFIPIAENNGMIIDISYYAFEKICKFIKDYKDKLPTIKFVEINLSPLEFVQNDLSSRILNVIRKYQLEPSMFNFEITETADMKSMPYLKKVMNELVEKGCSFSLDDYGTGYSNTKNIVDLPIKAIKIDKSILFAAMEGKEGYIVLDYLVKTIKAIKKEIIIEGVENEEMVKLLAKLDCNYHQGFYYSRPLSCKQLIEFFKKNNNLKGK